MLYKRYSAGYWFDINLSFFKPLVFIHLYINSWIQTFYSQSISTYLWGFLVLLLARSIMVCGSSPSVVGTVIGCPSWLKEPVRDPWPRPVAATSSKQLKKDAFCTSHLTSSSLLHNHLRILMAGLIRLLFVSFSSSKRASSLNFFVFIKKTKKS